jgi:hypothetical protein
MANARMRIERALLNLPRVVELEQRTVLAGLEDGNASTHFLSRLIIALNTVATELCNSASDGTSDATARQAADLLWDFGERSGELTDRLRMTTAARP